MTISDTTTVVDTISIVDTILQGTFIQKDSFYLVDTIRLSKKDLIEIANGINNPWIACFGTMGIGFVFGWIVAFINKHTATDNINTGYLTSIIASLLGTVVLTFFSNNKELLGWYGIGAFLGLAVYFILVIIYGFKDRDPDKPNPPDPKAIKTYRYRRAVDALFR